MSLSQLNWKQLPVVSITSSTIDAVVNGVYSAFTSSVYADATARVSGSNSAWTFNIELSSSTPVAAWGTAPTGSLQQRVIIAGSSVVQTPLMLAPDSFATDTLLGSVAKNASSYTTWSGSAPFTAGSFMGYAKMWDTSTGTPSLVRCYESEEAIAVFVQNTTANRVYGGIFGAIIDPESTEAADSETDGRVYGMVVCGTNYIFMDHGDANNGFFSYGNGNGNFHCFSFVPNSSTVEAIERSSTFRNIFADILSLTSKSGRLVKIPITFRRWASPIAFIGRLREIFLFRASVIGNSVSDGINTKGYIVSGNTASDAASFIFTTGSV